mmetsp:Transcript_6724/g.8790  ORF Transcript_6724/g.8790 Transcript_6724/m.8790 type:complete len:517 (-) Transcript_6724:1663-3213(-)|eukprot:CAMPEP_0204872590 /NCGR_PEP_ID=MMETSP1348-20121228/38400_1 /ASSEMBLY_ACC=CAM_ASM_000700 /TAXON_ID=215587 /ORGANISM="Aplanochytrium stocchinoi, Strain GSBS06" /LENGTH=516 /DNA_ID=CAMNT_0052027487 /DNA_START=394 /DNA_END=1944 /DNA_ORIENTATION=-
MNDPVYGRFWKMKKAGLPDGAIEQAMERDGVDPAGFKGFGIHGTAKSSPQPLHRGKAAGFDEARSASSPPTKFDPTLPPPPNLNFDTAKNKPLPPLPPRKKAGRNKLKLSYETTSTKTMNPIFSQKPKGHIVPEPNAIGINGVIPGKKTSPDKKKSPGHASRNRKLGKPGPFPKNHDDDKGALRQRLKKLESENANLRKKIASKNNTNKASKNLGRKASVNDIRKRYEASGSTAPKRLYNNRANKSVNGLARKNSVNDMKKKFNGKDGAPLKRISNNRASRNQSSSGKASSNVVKATPATAKAGSDIPKRKKSVNHIANKFEKGDLASTPNKPPKNTKAAKIGSLNASKLVFESKNKEHKQPTNKRLTGMGTRGEKGFGNISKFRNKIEIATSGGGVSNNFQSTKRNSFGNSTINTGFANANNFNAPKFGGGASFGVGGPSYAGDGALYGSGGPSFGVGGSSFAGGGDFDQYENDYSYNQGFNQFENEWTECFSEEYQTPYWYNEVTGESTWDSPW